MPLGQGLILTREASFSKLQEKKQVQIVASKLGNLPLGFNNSINNLLSLTSLEVKHLIGCGDKQRFVPPLVFCPWQGVCGVSLSTRTEAAELMGAAIVVPLCCHDPSLAIQLQPASLHDT